MRKLVQSPGLSQEVGKDINGLLDKARSIGSMNKLSESRRALVDINRLIVMNAFEKGYTG